MDLETLKLIADFGGGATPFILGWIVYREVMEHKGKSGTAVPTNGSKYMTREEAKEFVRKDVCAPMHMSTVNNLNDLKKTIDRKLSDFDAKLDRNRDAIIGLFKELQ